MPMNHALPRWLHLLTWLLVLCALSMIAGPMPAHAHVQAPGQAAVQNTVHVLTVAASDGLRHSVSLSGHLAALRDPGGAMAVSEAAAKAGEFKPLKGYVANGFTDDAVWVRFTLARTADAPAPWFLEATPTFLDAVTLYAPDGRGGFDATELGDRKPFADRPVRSRTFVFPLVLTAEPATFYLRIRTSSTLNMQAQLWQRVGMLDSRAASDMATGIVIGAIGIMFFFNLIFWIWLKDRVYLYYAAYLATLAFNMSFLNGYAARWWFNADPWLADQGVGVGVCLNNAAAVLFISRSLNLRELMPWARVMFEGIFVFFAVSLAVALTGNYAVVAPYVNVGALFITVGGMATAGLLLWRGHREHLIYMLSFVIFAVAHLFFMLRVLSVLDLGDVVEPMVHVGTVVHAVLLNIALVYRVRSSERNYREERRRALLIAQNAERALERKVAERTLSLEQEVERRSTLEAQLRDALASEQRALAEQRKFVAMVSHEFRTPLAIINAAAQSLSVTRLAQERPVQERVEKIGRAVSRLSAMIDNYLTEDKLSMDALPINAQPLDLRALMEESMQTVGEPESARLLLEHGESAVPVQCDHPLMVVALSNLVQNALKYSTSDARVRLRVHVADGCACADVEDAGEGVDAASVPRLFEKYFRARHTRQVAGTGLGLYLARVIARRHGGDVTLLRTGASGSVFRLTLPLA